MDERTPPERSAEARATARKNLFVAGMLHSAGEAYPVMIRDLSTAGAQIEGSLSLETGAQVILCRGRLSVQGHVTWVKNRRCGLRFASPISVENWIAIPVNRQQQRIDRVVAVVKSGALPPDVPVEGRVTSPAEAAQDLKRVSRLLETLSDALASDPAVVLKHGIPLQNLDIALQTLTALSGAMWSGGPHHAASVARLAELRVSCAEALQRTP